MKKSDSTSSFENLRLGFRNYFGFRISDFGFRKRMVSCLPQQDVSRGRLGGGGFTLIEIVVAIGILVMVMGFAGVIFQRSIGSYRVAMAQDEIMTKLRVITEQLDSDFRGLRKDAPMFIWFAKGTDPTYDMDNRFDQIMFFADGDFQSTQTYNSQPVVGNVARIYYGQAKSIDPQNKSFKNPDSLRPVNRLLARRQHILTADTTLPVWLDFSKFNVKDNNEYEYDSNSLSQWQAVVNDPTYGPTDANRVAAVCFDNRPEIDFSDPNTIHNLMLEGIGSFSIQWDYITPLTAPQPGAHYWWPALDPDGNPAPPNDSDFDGTYGMGNSIGIYFNSAYPGSGWFKPTEAQGSYYPPVADRPAYPKALKFVFVIYDSRGVFPNGQTFSHIVYLGD
jgi:type II secretory pathway pseudopilin PulG